MVVVAVAALAGCKAPSVSMRLAGVSVGATSDEGATLIFTLEARNEASEEVPLRKAHYELDVNGARVFSGARSAEAAVAARSVATFDLPVAVAWESLGVADAAGLAAAELLHHFRARVEYIPPDILGAALFTTGLHKPIARVEEQGALTFAPERAPAPPSDAPDADGSAQ